MTTEKGLYGVDGLDEKAFRRALGLAAPRRSRKALTARALALGVALTGWESLDGLADKVARAAVTS